MNNESIQEEPQAEATAPPTLAEQISALQVDDNTARRLQEIAAELGLDTLPTEVLSTLARGITHDDDMHNADAAGYLRGRNENIEAVMHRQPHDQVEAQATPIFPRYNRRSIWD